MTPTVMDAGPLVAWFCPKDEHHAWAEKVFDELPTGALVCGDPISPIAPCELRVGRLI